jgi:hypothetical protein
VFAPEKRLLLQATGCRERWQESDMHVALFTTSLDAHRRGGLGSRGSKLVGKIPLRLCKIELMNYEEFAFPALL